MLTISSGYISFNVSFYYFLLIYISCIQHLFLETALPLVTSSLTGCAESALTPQNGISELETIFRLRVGEYSFGFFCHLFDNSHFIMVFVRIDFVDEEVAEFYQVSMYVMDSLEGSMENILNTLKSNIEIAWKRYDIDNDKPLQFEDFNFIDCTQQADGSNDCLVASCCLLFHFYDNGLHLSETISTVSLIIFINHLVLENSKNFFVPISPNGPN